MEEIQTVHRISDEDQTALKAQFELILGGMNSIFNAYTFVEKPLSRIVEGEVTAENFEELLIGLLSHSDYGRSDNWPPEIQAATTEFIQKVVGIAEQLGFEMEIYSDF